MLVNDETRLLEWQPAHKVVMEAKGWPMGQARVTLTAEPGGPGEVLVTLVEDVTRGPARALPKPLRQALMLKRNSETLRRLAFLAEGRSPRTPQRLDDG